MKPLIKRRTFHLFLVLGILSFLSYWFTNGLPLVFLLIGPPIYGAALIKSLLPSAVPVSPWMEEYLLLLPVTIIYYGLIGLHQAYLKQERGWIGKISRFAMLLFLLGLHALSWYGLSAYYIPYR